MLKITITIIVGISIIATLSVLLVVITNSVSTQIYAAAFMASADPFIQLSVPLTADKIQFIPNQIMFHLDNQTSGAIESISNETGKNIIQYYKYNLEENTVTVSNSTIYTHYDLHITNLDNPIKTQIQKVNRAFDVIHIANPDTRFSIPSKTYFGTINSKVISTNGIKYDNLNIQVIIPYEFNKYQSLMIIYPSMSK